MGQGRSPVGLRNPPRFVVRQVFLLHRLEPSRGNFLLMLGHPRAHAVKCFSVRNFRKALVSHA